MIKKIAAVLCYNCPELLDDMKMQIPDCFVVDNGSTTKLFGDLTFNENLYFSGGWNMAMEYFIDYDYVWMMNSDIQNVSNEMFSALVDILESSPDEYMAITPSFNSPHSVFHRHGSGTRDVNWIDWCCPVVNVKKWHIVGGFDNIFHGYGADLDFCKRARDIGYKFLCSDDHYVNHLGSKTTISENKHAIMSNVQIMNDLIVKKWNVNSFWEMME